MKAVGLGSSRERTVDHLDAVARLLGDPVYELIPLSNAIAESEALPVGPPCR